MRRALDGTSARWKHNLSVPRTIFGDRWTRTYVLQLTPSPPRAGFLLSGAGPAIKSYGSSALAGSESQQEVNGKTLENL